MTATITTSLRYHSAAEWVHALGDVPLERIVFYPLPGTATESDVLEMERQNRLCELIDGTLVEKGMGYYESQVAIVIASLLLEFVRPRKLGVVTGEGGMMRLRMGNVRIPDVAFVSAARGKEAREERRLIPSISPDLAVEVLSEGNTKREIERKIAEYLETGCSLVWIVDPKKRTVAIHRVPMQAPEILGPEDTITGERVLPGFAAKVSDFFPVDEA